MASSSLSLSVLPPISLIWYRHFSDLFSQFQKSNYCEVSLEKLRMCSFATYGPETGSDKSTSKGKVWGKHEALQRWEWGLFIWQQLTDKLAKVCHETLLPQGDSAHVPACLSLWSKEMGSSRVCCVSKYGSKAGQMIHVPMVLLSTYSLYTESRECVS